MQKQREKETGESDVRSRVASGTRDIARGWVDVGERRWPVQTVEALGSLERLQQRLWQRDAQPRQSDTTTSE